MRSFRFMLSRRWVIFAVVVVLLAWAAWWLGQWQFGRLEDRKAKNEIVRTNETLEPKAVERVLEVGTGPSSTDEWRRVSATGTYDVDDTVIVRYRSNDRGATGVDVVVPLVTEDGTALVVDRGFIEVDARSLTADDVPAPPTGEVTVTGWVRVDGTGDSTQVSGGSTRAISSARIGAALDRPVYGGFVDAETESPGPETSMQTTELPDLSNGPHFFYGLQWWFFGLLAIFGFFYLAYDERRGGPREEQAPKQRRERRTNVPAAYQRQRKTRGSSADSAAQSERSMPPSTGSIAPETNEAAGDNRKAAARPNSSGSP